MIYKLFKLGLVGCIMLFLLATFAYTAGWLSPQRLTQTQIVDRFQQLNGVHSGFRRNHAKGVCVSGFFTGNGNGTTLSKALVFKSEQTPIVGRFALAGGNPYVADAAGIPRSLALQFKLTNGEEWRTGMNNIPVFPVKTPQAFYDLMLASKPDPATKKPNPTNMQAFLAKYPESAPALKLINEFKRSAGFDDATFNSLNAYYLQDAQGNSHLVRWAMVPVKNESGQVSLNQNNKNYLFDKLIATLQQQGKLQWNLIMTVGESEDASTDPTIPWPASRQQINVGTLTLDHIEGEDHGPCRNINYDPLILPAGIMPTDDPILNARSASYSVSFTRRVGEKQEPSAVVVNQQNGSVH